MHKLTVITLLLSFLLFGCKKKTNSSTPTSVTVYVSGYERVGANFIAKYWKNGVENILAGGGVANGIFVSGSDIYVCGQQFNGAITTAKYWKNGTAINLTNGTNSAVANAITVVNNNIYVAGWEQIGKYPRRQ